MPSKRSRVERDNGEYLDMLRRMVVAYQYRAADSDLDHLAALRVLEDQVRQATQLTVDGLRASGHTWQDIGTTLGVTRQAALMRWGA